MQLRHTSVNNSNTLYREQRIKNKELTHTFNEIRQNVGNM